jgi:hypothetical protein
LNTPNQFTTMPYAVESISPQPGITDLNNLQLCGNFSFYNITNEPPQFANLVFKLLSICQNDVGYMTQIAYDAQGATGRTFARYNVGVSWSAWEAIIRGNIQIPGIDQTADLNLMTDSGEYVVASPINGPAQVGGSPGTPVYVSVFNAFNSTNFVSQLLWGVTDIAGVIFRRKNVGGTWTSWFEDSATAVPTSTQALPPSTLTPAPARAQTQKIPALIRGSSPPRNVPKRVSPQVPQ